MSAGVASCTLALPVVSSSSVSVPSGFSLLANLSQQEQEVAAAAALARSAAADLHGLLPELNGADLAMSLSPKHHQPHTTPFSVTDILSPIEESYRKLELSGSGAPPSPYRSSTGGSSAGSSSGGVGAIGVVTNVPSAPSPSGGAAATAVMAANPYMHVGQLSHHQFPAQYCNGSDISTHYGDMRNSGWYGATANDPRFASKYDHRCQYHRLVDGLA